MSLAQILIFILLAGTLIHAYALASLVPKRDSTFSAFTVTGYIVFSSLWFVGPVTYFIFRKKHSYLARCCLQQVIVATTAWIAMALVSDHLRLAAATSRATSPPASIAHQ
jgi:hypothetical protein